MDDKYKAYLLSNEWKQIRIDLITIRGSKCEKCSKKTNRLQVHHLTYGLQISEGTNSVGIVRWDLGFCLCAVSCCFFSLIISTLENILKISLKKFANSNKGCIFVSTKTVKQ